MKNTRISAWTRMVLLLEATRYELPIYELDDEDLDQLGEVVRTLQNERSLNAFEGLDGDASAEVAA